MAGRGGAHTGDEGVSMRKKKNTGGLKDCSGNRPGKKARMHYQALATMLEEKVRTDPTHSLESEILPAFIRENEALKAKLLKRLEAVRAKSSSR